MKSALKYVQSGMSYKTAANQFKLLQTTSQERTKNCSDVADVKDLQFLERGRRRTHKGADKKS